MTLTTVICDLVVISGLCVARYGFGVPCIEWEYSWLTWLEADDLAPLDTCARLITEAK